MVNCLMPRGTTTDSAGSRQTMQDYEKLGLFYLGKTYDMQSARSRPNLLLYESKDLTTHAVCVGMTGSGKTGLGIALLEEAAIDGIPVIAIDPKGDLGNLLLAFPRAAARGFPALGRSGRGRPAGAHRRAVRRPDGRASGAKGWPTWGQDGARIARFRDAVDLAIYTPGSSAGLPLTVLRSFDAPPPGLVGQAEAYRERISSAVSGLLALLGIVADPISSREHILLSNVLDHSWRVGNDLDMARLIHAVQSPPFQKVGVIDLETFFPAKDRFALAMKLNNLLASPGFAAWMDGEPLDVGGLALHAGGKAAAVDHVDRPPVGQRADVLRHDPPERGAGLGAHPAGHVEPAGDPLHGRDLRLLSPRSPTRRRSCRCSPCSSRHAPSAWASCWRPRTRSTSTTRGCPTPARGSWAACRPSATRIACSRDWRGPRPRPGTPSTARRWTRSSRGWATASS